MAWPRAARFSLFPFPLHNSGARETRVPLVTRKTQAQVLARSFTMWRSLPATPSVFVYGNLLEYHRRPQAPRSWHLTVAVPPDPRKGPLWKGQAFSSSYSIRRFVCLFRATPSAYGSSQARGPIGAVVTGQHHSNSNARSEPRLQPKPHLRAMPDP